MSSRSTLLVPSAFTYLWTTEESRGLLSTRVHWRPVQMQLMLTQRSLFVIRTIDRKEFRGNNSIAILQSNQQLLLNYIRWSSPCTQSSWDATHFPKPPQKRLQEVRSMRHMLICPRWTLQIRLFLPWNRSPRLLLSLSRWKKYSIQLLEVESCSKCAKVRQLSFGV